MSIGAGLAGFVRGAESGMRMRESYDRRQRQKKFDDERMAINDQAKSAFVEAKAAGAVQDNDFMNFYTNYAVPKQQALLVEQGDYKGAHALGEWSKSEDAQSGAKLYSSALLKAQSGDYEGAFQEAIAAGKIKGYINTDFKLEGYDPLIKDGKVVGYQIRSLDADGKTITNNLRLEEIPKALGTYLNPEAAWQSQQEATAGSAKREADLQEFEAKEQIKQKYSTEKIDPNSKRYQDTAIALAKNDLNWADRSPEERDKLIRSELNAADQYGQERGGTASGSPQPPAPQRIIVDKKEGKVITGTEQGASVGLPAVTPAQAAQPATPKNAPVESEPQGLPNAPVPQDNPRKALANTVEDARSQLKAGGNPEAVKQQLLNAGVPQNQWPTELNKTSRVAQTSGFGLP